MDAKAKKGDETDSSGGVHGGCAPSRQAICSISHIKFSNSLVFVTPLKGFGPGTLIFERNISIEASKVCAVLLTATISSSTFCTLSFIVSESTLILHNNSSCLRFASSRNASSFLDNSQTLVSASSSRTTTLAASSACGVPRRSSSHATPS